MARTNTMTGTRRLAAAAVTALVALGASACGGGSGSETESPAAAPSTETDSPSISAPAEPAGPRLMLPVPGPEFAVGGACPDVFVSGGDAGVASYVVSGEEGVEQWEPEFDGEPAPAAETGDPAFTAGVTSDGDSFLVAVLVTEQTGGGTLEADATSLEVTTLDFATGEPLGPNVALPWDAADPVPFFDPCVTEQVALETPTGDTLGSGTAATVVDLTTGEQVFSEPLATAENTGLAVNGDRVLATFASTYEAVQNTGQAPITSAPLSGGETEVVIGGNAFDYAYFGVGAAWIPGLVGGDKQPASTSDGIPYESYTFPVDGGEPIVTTLDTIGSVLDYYDPVTSTKLMVAVDTDDGAAAVAAVDYETGDQVALDWFPNDPGALDIRIYGFYDGMVWATSKGEPIAFTLDGAEVPEAAGWVTYPLYAGEGWAVLADIDDTRTGIVFDGDLDPALTTTAVEEFE